MHRLGELLVAGWQRHPLKASLEAGAPAVRAAFEPLVRKHPLRLLAFAAVLGGLLVGLRPWRLLSRAALTSMLVSALLPRAAIARWWSSGQWLEVLRSEHLRHWFEARRPKRTSQRDEPPPSPDEHGRGTAETPVPMHDTQATQEAPASYVPKAPSPIPAPQAPP